MEDKKITPAYRVLRGLIRFFYPRIKVVGAENLPAEASIIVANHSQMNGPIAGELHFPGPHYIWCAAQMMHAKEVPGYAFTDFWSFKPRRVRWLYRILSYLIVPLAVCLFNNAHTIPVYRDARVMSTFRETIARLREGANVIIFPERNEKYNHILYAFQDRFIDIARFYHHQTGVELCFVPMYVAPKLRQMVIGKPVRFNAAAPIEQERQRICEAMMAEITRLAEELPPHTVVPYRNIPRREYPTNQPNEVKHS